MLAAQKQYWPFDVLPTERQSEQHRQEIRFLETAYPAGYKPYTFGSQNFGATAEERAGEIIYRGCQGKHWEVLLLNVDKLIVSAHVDGFEHAAQMLLRWLDGEEGSEIVEQVLRHLFSTAAAPSGFVLYSPAADPRSCHNDGVEIEVEH